MVWSNAGRHTLTTGALPLGWSDASSRPLSRRFIFSAIAIASGLKFFTSAGKYLDSKMSVRRVLSAGKPASAASGG